MSEPLARLRRRAEAPLARLQEAVGGLRDFERFSLPAPSALTVICDDGEEADLEVIDVLAAAGVRGVIAVSPALAGQPGFLGLEQLEKLRDAGHEIAFHGNDHQPFTELLRTGRLLGSIDEGLRRMADDGFMPTTLVYPCGSHHGAVRAAVAGRFDCAFTTWAGINRQVVNRYAIRRIAFGAHAGRWPPSEAWYRRCIERAAAGSGHWPVLMLHPGAQGHHRAHNALLARLLNHARNVGLPVRTASQYMAAAFRRDVAALQLGRASSGAAMQPSASGMRRP